MTTTINGRTPEEIKQGLGYCCPKWESGRWVTCRDECPFRNEHAFCKNVLMACTLALLCRLEFERDELLQKNQQLERERDAAVAQLKEVDVSSYFECAHCKHEELCDSPVWPCNDCDNEECPCHTCSEGSNWQWRGPQEVE